MKKLACLAGAIALVASVSACSSSSLSAAAPAVTKGNAPAPAGTKSGPPAPPSGIKVHPASAPPKSTLPPPVKPGTTASAGPNTEVLNAQLIGPAAANWLNQEGTTPLPPFNALAFTGPVATQMTGQVVLGLKDATHTFSTPEGDYTISRTITTNRGAVKIVGKDGNTCHISVLGRTGNYTVDGSQSTGKFAGATGSGEYSIVVLATAQLKSGATTCSEANLGPVLTQGTTVTFHAAGTLMVKS